MNASMRVHVELWAKVEVISTMEYRPLYNVKYTFRHEIKYKEKEKRINIHSARNARTPYEYRKQASIKSS